MAVGVLKQYLYETIDGDTVYITRIPDIRLGGLESSKAYIPIDFYLPEGVELIKSILELGLYVPRERLVWRLKLNGVPITREFKTDTIASLRDRYYGKLVYDVTPILAAREKRRRIRCGLLIKYDGSEEIRLSHIGLLIAYSTSDAKSCISMLSGAYILDPGERQVFQLKHPTGLDVDGELRTILFTPSKQARISISFNGVQLSTIEGVVGGEEIASRVSNISGLNSVEVYHLESETRYYPKELVLSTIALIQKLVKEPELVVKEILVPEKIERGGKIKAVIVNNGESKPDKALVSILSLGTTITQKNIPKLEPGEETIVEIPIDLPKGSYNLVFRVIWKKLSHTSFRDKKISITIV